MSEKEENNSENICPICYLEYDIKECVPMVLGNCGHTHCFNCIKNGNLKKCSMCQTKIDKTFKNSSILDINLQSSLFCCICKYPLMLKTSRPYLIYDTTKHQFCKNCSKFPNIEEFCDIKDCIKLKSPIRNISLIQ